MKFNDNHSNSDKFSKFKQIQFNQIQLKQLQLHLFESKQIQPN